MFHFYKAITMTALHGTWSRLMPQKGEIVKLVFVTALLWTGLFLTNPAGLQDKMSEFGLLVVAFVLTGSLFFVYDLLKAPVVLHEQQEEKIRQSREIIDKVIDKHDLLDRTIALYERLEKAYDEGYRTEDEHRAWLVRMEAETDEAIEFIRNNLGTAMAFRVKNNRAGGYRAFPLEEEWRAGWGHWADNPRRAAIWGRIDGVKRVIEASGDYWRVDLDALRV